MVFSSIKMPCLVELVLRAIGVLVIGSIAATMIAMALPPPPQPPQLVETSDLWLVQLHDSGSADDSTITASDADVNELAERYGYRLYRRLHGFPNTFLFEPLLRTTTTTTTTTNRTTGVDKRSGTNPLPTNHLPNDQMVKWADQQVPLVRTKRDDFYGQPPLRQYPDDDWLLMNAIDMTDEAYANMDDDNNNNNNNNNLDATLTFNDELWHQQWYIQDTRSQWADPRRMPKLDLNVLPVWQRGITGKGVRVAVLDDGLEHTHDDIRPNYDAEISYDINHDRADPSPNYPFRVSSHGTRCAGEIAMVANNHKCGVGIAYDARIGGIKLLGGNVYDMIEGMALGHAYDKIDVYSSSWGPTDNGQSLDRPGRLAAYALRRGIREGRRGRGAVYVWASGNGGSIGDNCNCDGHMLGVSRYAASIYTITIGSASQRGTLPWYGEKCSSILAVTYSSGAYQDQMITTTDVNNACTVQHTGTSASAPLAAGIVALALEANKNLTWRDVQHLIVATSEFAPLQDNDGWQESAASRLYNVGFGFGLMNADAMVTAALNWTNVQAADSDTISSCDDGGGEQRIQAKRWSTQMRRRDPNNATETDQPNSGTIPLASIYFDYGGAIRYLEHVELTINVEYTVRGALAFHLTSPGNTRVQLLSARPMDRSAAGFLDWNMMSVATWSENPVGKWLLEVTDDQTAPVDGHIHNHGRLYNCTLTVHGTVEQPAYQRNGPRVYDANYIRRLRQRLSPLAPL